MGMLTAGKLMVAGIPLSRPSKADAESAESVTTTTMLMMTDACGD